MKDAALAPSASALLCRLALNLRAFTRRLSEARNLIEKRDLRGRREESQLRRARKKLPSSQHLQEVCLEHARAVAHHLSSTPAPAKETISALRTVPQDGHLLLTAFHNQDEAEQPLPHREHL